jgi:hypothetical protein
LRHADAPPELLLVETEPVADLSRVEASVSLFHVRVMSEGSTNTDPSEPAPYPFVL